MWIYNVFMDREIITHMHIYAHKHPHTSPHTDTYKNRCTYTTTYTYTFAWTCTYAYMYIRVRTQARTHTHIQVHTYIYIHRKLHIHTHIHGRIHDISLPYTLCPSVLDRGADELAPQLRRRWPQVRIGGIVATTSRIGVAIGVHRHTHRTQQATIVISLDNWIARWIGSQMVRWLDK